MHPSEYREDKSGKAKEKFAEEWERAKIIKTATRGQLIFTIL
jgi:hypothetical protein